jgi:uncharacterized protein (DUF433 family)
MEGNTTSGDEPMDKRITIEPGKRSGQPCILGLRITVADVLGWLNAGISEEQILADFPELEDADFQAAREYASAEGVLPGQDLRR